MKKIVFFSLMIIASFLYISCTAQTENSSGAEEIAQAGSANVYYFHYTRRCATCQAVETVSSEGIKELFGDRVLFAEYNLDEEEGKEKAEQLGVSGQTLLIVKGDKKINITNEGFMYARSNPEKLKQIISDNITPLL